MAVLSIDLRTMPGVGIVRGLPPEYRVPVREIPVKELQNRSHLAESDTLLVSHYEKSKD